MSEKPLLLNASFSVSGEVLEFIQLPMYSFFLPHCAQFGKSPDMYFKIAAIHAVNLGTDKREEVESWIPVKPVILTFPS